MIPANNLKIGNWVNVPHGNVCIEKFVNEGVHFTDGCGGNFQPLEPIPLTPEILLKCGFEKAKGQVTFWYYKIKNINLCFRLLNGVLIYKIDSSFNLEINSLHQLQNLFFAITGEELEVHL